MKRPLIYLMVLLSSLPPITIPAQSFPHLNASTGNWREFPVDKDTNIFMFHENRLVKTGKNFNTVWAKTYNGMRITNLLLSKTGSMYFIADNFGYNTSYFVGKIDANGNFVWGRNLSTINAVISGSSNVTYSTVCNSLLLDRNNQLIISGTINNTTGYFLKTDTNGNAIKFKVLKSSAVNGFLSGLSIAYDSLGFYHFIGNSPTTVGPSNGLGVTRYNDISDQLGLTNCFYYKNGTVDMSWQYVRSKFNNNFYIHLSYLTNPASYNVGLLKCSVGGMQKWNIEMSSFDGAPFYGAAFSKGVNESPKGQLFYQIDGFNSTQYFKSGVFGIDSTGVVSPTGVKLVDNFYQDQVTYPLSSHHPQTIFGNNHYIDVVSGSLPSNPLTAIKFDSNFSSSCTLSTTCTYTNTWTGCGGNFTNTLAAVTSFSINNFSTTGNTVAFSVNSGSCSILSTHLSETSMTNEFRVKPNPAIDHITFDQSVSEMIVHDIFGKIILQQNEESSQMNVQSLAPGLYFVHFTIENRTFVSKFIKE